MDGVVDGDTKYLKFLDQFIFTDGISVGDRGGWARGWTLGHILRSLF